jgi:hypothetical protein
MRWFRVHASRVAAVALLSLAVVELSAAAPHEDDCHDVCQPMAVEHDASAHRITAPAAADDHPLHCLVCHWARSFRSPRTESRLMAMLADERGISLHPESLTAAVSAPVAQPPLRSPPPPPALA